MIPEPQPYDPDDPDAFEETTDELGYRLPGRLYPGDVIDYDESMLY